MFRSSRLRRLLPLGALALAMALGGCYAYPAYPGYGYYGGGYYDGGYPAPYYGGGVVAFGGGWGWHGGGGWHEHGWHHRD
jgi:hypothetical protein